MTRLEEIYNREVVKSMVQDMGYKSVMQVPRIRKVVVNSGIGDAQRDPTLEKDMIDILTVITGQRPVVTKAKKAIASFKVREGMNVGVMVTLRNDLMWEFLDKLINIVLPRVKDFHGLKTTAFDGNGNYSLGITDHVVFPEIDPNSVQKIRELQVTIDTNTKRDKDALVLLDKLEFPIVKDGKEV
jgi:large subunit ribosomal protein L5